MNLWHVTDFEISMCTYIAEWLYLATQYMKYFTYLILFMVKILKNLLSHSGSEAGRLIEDHLSLHSSKSKPLVACPAL